MGQILHRKSEDGWVYTVYSQDTPADTLGRYAKFKRLWDSKRKSGALPAWKDYELEDFADWYGWISVEDLIPGPTFDSVYRLWGTEISRFYGVDLTNKRMSDFSGELFSPEDLEILNGMLGTHNFRICSGPRDWRDVPARAYSVSYSFIELPLADDGQTVDRYINMAFPFSSDLD